MIKKGDIVYIKKEFQDEGDDKFIWHAFDDEEKGRVTIGTDIPEFWIQPLTTISTSMLEVKCES